VDQSSRRRQASHQLPESPHTEPTLEQAAPRETQEAEVAQARTRPGTAGWRSLIEQRIQDGIERGLFDNLAGAGKPLNLEEDALVPEDMRMAFRLLRTHGLAPLWVELNKEIRQDIERLHRFRLQVHERVGRTNPIQWEHRRREFITRVEDINAKIRNYNILAPSSQVHLHAIILEDELREFDRL
jgi:DnaJ homolog subfamily C member 28